MRSRARFRLHVFLCALCVGTGIAFFLVSPLVFAQDTSADEPVQNESLDNEPAEETAIELERFAVTGSRIRRVDAEGSLPVTIIDREMIELSGESSVADFLRSLSFNSFGSYRSVMGSADQGTAQISLRGLGSNRSLVLIDGRRLPKAPQSTAYQDINTIPMGAVERIEILSDGASAIYGSDAIGGVVNVITREDYNGWELMYGRSEPSAGGKSDYGSVMFGTSDTNWNLIATLSWNDRDISFDRDFGIYEPAESFYSNNFGTRDPEYGFPNWDITDIPGGCDNSDAFYLLPDPWSLSGEICAYDWYLVQGSETSVGNKGAMLKAEYDINTDWSVWLNTSIVENDSFGRQAPQPNTSIWSGYVIPVDGSNNPTNPDSHMYDPAFGPNVEVDYWHRFDSLGNRDSNTENQLIDLQIGMTGWVGSTEVDFGLRRSWNSTKWLYSNYLNYELAEEYIADGTYDLQNSLDNPEEVLDALRFNPRSDFNYDQNEVFATVSWDLFKINAIPVKWVAGGEFRQEMFDSDDWGVQRQTDRDVTSLFFETLLAVTDKLEISVAGRYDNYSDWGSDFSPKLSLRWRVTDKVMLRASAGQGFRAPELFIGTEEPFTDLGVTDQDPQSCEVIGRPPGCYIQYQRVWTVSPALSSETSDQYSLGMAWQPSDWFSLTLDYYDITLKEEISFFEDWLILNFEQTGHPVPAGLGVTRNQDGLILSITSGWGNQGLVETSGLDINAQLIFDLGPGSWNSNFQMSYVFEYVTDDDIDWVGAIGNPQSRATFSNSYTIGDFILAWNIQYIDSQEYIDSQIWLDGDEQLPAWVTHDLQINYLAPWNGQFSIGARNVFDEKPPQTGNYYDTWLYKAFGRILYAKYTQTF